MDPGRYGHQQEWDNNSALEGYGAAHEPNYRVGGSNDDRRFPDERCSRPDVYSRTSLNKDFTDRDNYPPSGSIGIWPQSRRSYEDEYAIDRDSRRHDRQYVDSYHEINSYQEHDKFRDVYHSVDNYPDRGFNRHTKFMGRAHDDHGYDDYDPKRRISREDSRNTDYEYGRYSYDSDYDKGGRRDGSRRRHNSYDQECEKRTLSRDRDQSPHRRHERSRSRSHSHGHDDRSRSKSPRGRSRSRSQREDSFDDYRYDRSDRRRDREEKRQRRIYSTAPSATVVVKGLSQKTTEEDLYQILADWGPLRHVRVIKERNSGVSRGFAFVDFPSVDAASIMMEKVGNDGLVVDGWKLFFEYSSKPTEGAAGPYTVESSGKSGCAGHRSITVPSDWMCTFCDCVNFARRTSCFQCNEPRSDDAPPADVASSNLSSFGKKGFEAGPTHVLVVRGLDENADEEMLRYEFSKHAAIKDLRLVRDKFTHVSRGFAFVHFHSVDDAARALEATNGTTLEKNGQILRVQYAKSIVGPGSGSSGPTQSSSLAAAAIEAAAFAQQYDAVGWAPKEYNPDEKQTNCGQDEGVTAGEAVVQNNNSAPQSGFVWDEASGYYYDAASGFYYDGNTGFYYDGNNGIWYSYDNESQQYIPFIDQTDKAPGIQSGCLKTSNDSISRKVVISAPAATITSAENATSLSDAVQAAANAALAAEKKEKEKSKEIKVASKSIILANKKKMNNVLTMWKQRSHEGQATRVVLEDNQSSFSADDRQFAAGQLVRSKLKTDSIVSRENMVSPAGVGTITQTAYSSAVDSYVKARPVSNSSGGSLMGVIRGSVRGASYSGAPSANPVSTSAASALGSSINADTSMAGNPFKTDVSALTSYTPPVSSAGGKRRFSEMPSSSSQRETPQANTIYRDRAAERRSLYGSLPSVTNDDDGFRDSNRDVAFKKTSLSSMPFPPGVGGGRGAGDGTGSSQSYEVITANKAIDENNVGNRMLRSMGWHEGSGLGKDGSGMIEPVQAHSGDSRAGLGSQQKRLLDPTLEVQAGDSYKTLIQKKALARFREMS